MRSTKFAPGEYYHLLNRGTDKKKIFTQTTDYIRFLFLILYCQSPVSFNNIGYSTKSFKTTNNFRVSSDTELKIISNRYVELVGFSLMPNHFHLLVLEKEEGGISRYMQRIQNAYTKYFNLKNEISGHLLQGPFRAVHIEDNEQLLYLSAYIHKNCCELNPKWLKNPDKYPWSSLMDYTQENRWEKLLSQNIILDQFKDKAEYLSWVKENPAKIIED